MTPTSHALANLLATGSWWVVGLLMLGLAAHIAGAGVGILSGNAAVAVKKGARRHRLARRRIRRAPAHRAGMIEREAEYMSPPWARTAGLFYVGTIVCGVFSAYFVRGAIVVHGDAVATAHNMLAMEPLWRAGIAAEAVGTLCYVAVTAILYDMLKPVSRRLSVMAALFSLVGCGIGMANLTSDLAPLVLLHGVPSMGSFTPEQVQGLAYAFLRLGGVTNTVGLLCFAFYCVLIGTLIFRSGFIPKAVGAIMAVAGMCWMIGSFAAILSPPLAQILTPLQFVGILGEATLTLWLVTRGVDVPRWQDAAASAIPLGRI